MRGGRVVSRRSVLVGGGLGAAALLLGGAPAGAGVLAPRSGAANGAAAAVGDPLWQQAIAKGIVYGSSTATWQVGPDPAYSQLFQREAGRSEEENRMKREAAAAHPSPRVWRHVVIVAAIVSALVAGLVAQAGRTTASEPDIRELRLEAPPLDPACRELIAIPKRGWVCEERRPDSA